MAKLELHIHVHNNEELKEVLDVLYYLRRKVMAESAEVAAFRARVETALANLGADLQRLISNTGGLNAEDKAALEEFATKIENLAAIVPET